LATGNKSMSVQECKSLFQTFRGTLFSETWWENYLLKRRAPLADFTFEEVEIELCSRLFPIILDRGNTIDLSKKRLLPKRERSRNGRRSSLWRAPSRSRSRSKDELLYISENEGDNEKTKRLKREMRGAQDDLHRLPALEEVTEEAEQDEEVDKELVDQAKKMIEILNEKKNLRSAISQKEIKELEEVLERIEKKGWVRRLQEDYNEGQKLLARLRTYEKMRHQIMALTQPTISEIRSYQYPPKQVESVMRATYILLGEKTGRYFRLESPSSADRKIGR